MQPVRRPDPKGGAHGRAPFSDRAMEWRVRKPRKCFRSPDCSVRGGHFFLVIFFFGPAKKKSLGRGSGRKPGLFPKTETAEAQTTKAARERPSQQHLGKLSSLDQELVELASLAGFRRQPARLLAAAGPGFLRVGRIAVLRRDLAELAAGGGGARLGRRLCAC